MVRRGILLIIFYDSIAFIEKCNKICEKPLTSCVEIWYDCITSCRGLFFCALFYMGQDLSTIHCRFICALCICGSQNLPQREAQGHKFLRNRNVLKKRTFNRRCRYESKGNISLHRVQAAQLQYQEEQEERSGQT